MQDRLIDREKRSLASTPYTQHDSRTSGSPSVIRDAEFYFPGKPPELTPIERGPSTAHGESNFEAVALYDELFQAARSNTLRALRDSLSGVYHAPTPYVEALLLHVSDLDFSANEHDIAEWAYRIASQISAPLD